MEKYHPGDIVEGKVISVKSYGAFVLLEGDLIGLLHISEIAHQFIDNINNFFNIGENIKVKILDINYLEKRAKLSLKINNTRLKNKPKKVNLSEEEIDAEKEFANLRSSLDTFINDAKRRLKIND